MLIDAPDDRYRDQPRRSWGRLLKLVAGAIACFVVGALILPWIGYLLDVAAVAMLLIALDTIDD